MRARFLLLFLAILFVLTISPQITQAQGCSITRFDMQPNESQVSLGTHVVLIGESNCGTVRFTVNGNPRAETSSSNQTETIKTEEFGTGTLELCFIARGDGGWENANRSCKNLYVQGSQSPPPGSTPGGNVKCWVTQFTVTPGEIRIGDTAQFAAYGQCDGNARAARFYINGEDWGEFGGNTTSASWDTSGYSAGSYEICFGITGGEWSQEARSCTSIRLIQTQQPPTPSVNEGPQTDNNQPGQTSESGPGNQNNSPPQNDNQQPQNSPSNNSNGLGGGGNNPPSVSGSGQLLVVGYQWPPSGEYVCVITGRINVRNGPNVNNTAIAQAPQGACFNYLGSSSGWYQVSWGSGTGWVSGGSQYTR